MIQTVIQDIFISAFVAVLFAWTGRNQLSFEPRLGSSRIFRRLLIYQAFIWTPVAGYLVFAYPSWSWWYLLPEDRLNLGFKILPLLVEFLVAVGAFVCLRELWLSRFTLGARLFVWTIGAITALLLVLPMDVVIPLGTFDEFHAGIARPIYLPSRFWLEMGIGSAIFWAAIYLILKMNRADHLQPRGASSDKMASPPAPGA